MSIDQLRDVKLITALITPFHEDGSINYDALPELIEHLLAHHTEALLLAGTTAESPTLTHDEELELFAAVQKIVNGRVPLIAGVGTNDTRDSIEFAKEVAKFGGFAAGLAIVPYYNKPSQEGMYQHFKAIADASDLPIIIYNIPGRVVVEMAPVPCFVWRNIQISLVLKNVLALQIWPTLSNINLKISWFIPVKMGMPSTL